MLQIGQDTIVSFDVIEKKFCCDLNVCKGICCIDGDAGAPLEKDEIKLIEQMLPHIWDDLSEEAQRVIKAQGVWYTDPSGDAVTSIVHGADCVFSYTDETGCCKCLLEKAFREGKSTFLKPISCHLYPIRLQRFPSFTAVNYHQWDVCQCARQCGEQAGIPIYKFLQEPLIRRFGQAWYDELDLAAGEWLKQKQAKIDKKNNKKTIE